MRTIQMVDLHNQYLKIKSEVDFEMAKVIAETSFINGKAVKEFSENLAKYTKAKHVIPCANGTDALQIALMALDLPARAEIITPGFSYAALAEAILLLGYKPVFIDVNPHTYNIDENLIEQAITANTKVIAPVHLYGQCANMEPILAIAKKHNLFVIEDTAQAIGAVYTFKNGETAQAGTMGDIGTTSFFPSKNLGCYGDGGAIFTNNDALAEKMKMIVNHGQKVKYYHEIIGVNSRLDSIQAAVLKVKLTYLDSYSSARLYVAQCYNKAFANHSNLKPAFIAEHTTHVFHQYTLQLCGINRADMMEYLTSKSIPSMIYYPVPLHKQNAYKQDISLPITESLCECVMSLPISTEMDDEQINYICETVLQFCKLI